MNNRKCPACGLVNFAGDEACRRCAAALDRAAATATREPPLSFAPARDSGVGEHAAPRRSLLTRISAGLVVAALLVVVLHTSLLLTSEPITDEERQTVMRAVRVLEERGFAAEAWRLRHIASFRRTDNWWNRYLGHAEAYAATNFPFQIVTLYPDFFRTPADDTERAAVLLHEAQHMTGADEERAFAEVWLRRAQLGWTEEIYGATRIFRGTRQLTREYVPQLFGDAASDAARRAD